MMVIFDPLPSPGLQHELNEVRYEQHRVRLNTKGYCGYAADGLWPNDMSANHDT